MNHTAQASAIHQQAILLNDPSAAIPFNSNSNVRVAYVQDNNE